MLHTDFPLSTSLRASCDHSMNQIRTMKVVRAVVLFSTFDIFSVAVQAYTDGAVFRQTFEDPNVEDWSFDELIRVQDYVRHGSPRGRILRVEYPPNERGSPRVAKYFDIEQITEATLSFDVKLHSQFEFVRGGKMHGLGGGKLTNGCDQIDPDGWSVRLMWREEGVPQLYVYHQDRVERCGDGYEPTDFQFKRAQWYRIDLHVKMNSSPDIADGETALYINGKKMVGVDNLRLSGNAHVDIDKFKFSTFYGGSSSDWSPSKTTYIYYDNFTVKKGLEVSGYKATKCEIVLGGFYSPNDDVCCDNECGSCGGFGCSDLPGGSSQCCTGEIEDSGTMCEEGSSAPCRGVKYNRSECETFLGGIYSSQVCCDSMCGSCGGPGCSELPGGSCKCCTGDIRASGIMCEEGSSAPCTYSYEYV